nr:MAG TPA: hypothetical protein [Caudoviricetes sp.]
MLHKSCLRFAFNRQREREPFTSASARTAEKLRGSRPGLN